MLLLDMIHANCSPPDVQRNEYGRRDGARRFRSPGSKYVLTMCTLYRGSERMFPPIQHIHELTVSLEAVEAAKTESMR